MEQKEISNTTLALMISVAIFFDVLQFIIGLVPIAGQYISVMVTIIALPTFYLWFKIYGRSFMSPKKVMALGCGTIIELIPILNILPGWTVAVIFLVGIERAEKAAIKILGKGSVGASIIQSTKNLRNSGPGPK